MPRAMTKAQRMREQFEPFYRATSSPSPLFAGKAGPPIVGGLATPAAAVDGIPRKQALGYPGSKNAAGVCERLISLMPAHHTYVAGFAGHDAIYFRKKPAAAAIVIDADGEAAGWWGQFQKHGPLSPPLSIVHQDFRRWVRSVEAQPILSDRRTLLYLDPPYLRETRSDRRMWRCEMDTPEEHAELLDLVKPMPCMVMLSGYQSDLYTRTLIGWRVAGFRTGTRGGPRTEVVWMNYPAGLVLHDCRFVGWNFRERERIKKRRLRWVRRFAKMPPEERQVIAEALAAVDERIPHRLF